MPQPEHFDVLVLGSGQGKAQSAGTFRLTRCWRTFQHYRGNGVGHCPEVSAWDTFAENKKMKP